MFDLRSFRTLRALLLVTPLVACSSTEKPRGELMIAVATDMSIPKNLDQVEVLISLPDGTEQRLDYPILPSSPNPVGKPMPGTLALVPPNAGGQTVRVRLIAQQDSSGGNPVSRVVREAIVKVPTDRVALLPMPLHWLCDGLVKQDTDGSYTADCNDPDQTCVAGKCVDAAVATDKLRTFDPGLVFGGGDDQGNGGTCIDVQACFAASTLATPDKDCTLPLPKSADPTSFNVAIELSSGSDGECTTGKDSRCFLPLDSDPDEGFQIVGDRVQLPPVVCEKIATGKALGVATTTACPTKDPSEPICGPWTTVTTSSTDSGNGSSAGGASSLGGSNSTAGDTSAGNAGGSSGVGKAGASSGTGTGGAPSSGQAGAASDGGGAAPNGGTGGKGISAGGSSTGGSAAAGGFAGTSSGTAGAGGSCGVCPHIIGPANALPIDDLEDGNATLLAVAQRTGSWYAINDGTGGMQTPSPGGQWFSTTQNCHGGAGFCAQNVGANFSTWGSQMGFSFTAPCGCVYDGSAYKGITFWARSNVALRTDILIAPLLNSTNKGGTCVQTADLLCDNQYGMDLPQSPGWVQYTMTFGSLSQQAWAKQYVMAPFDPTQLTGITFTAPVNTTFNYAVDDVSFF